MSKRIDWRNLIELDRNYPVDRANARDLGSRLLGIALEAVGINQEDSDRRKEAQDKKR